MNRDTEAARFDPALIARWRPEAFDADACRLPLIGAAEASPIFPDLDLWDYWPLERTDGRIARIDGREYWFFLSAPRFADPGRRHDEARIRLITRDASGWHDLGPALPRDCSPGSREWAGSAVLGEDGERVTLYFTAAGRAGQPHSFEQRLFEIDGRLADGTIDGWSAPREIVASDGVRYVAAQELVGVPGAIKAFRDPAFFRDPATGDDHILFTASAGWNDDPHNGLIGRAVRNGKGWRLADPLVEGVGVNNEFERPHIRLFGERYYLFFSTQSRTFGTACAVGPNGLYAFSADHFQGPWTPVNGSGLVAANPASEPIQAYSWWVDGDGDVSAFVDHWGMAGRRFDTHPETLRGQFGGTPAPTFRLAFDGDRVKLAR